MYFFAHEMFNDKAYLDFFTLLDESLPINEAQEAFDFAIEDFENRANYIDNIIDALVVNVTYSYLESVALEHNYKPVEMLLILDNPSLYDFQENNTKIKFIMVPEKLMPYEYDKFSDYENQTFELIFEDEKIKGSIFYFDEENNGYVVLYYHNIRFLDNIKSDQKLEIFKEIVKHIEVIAKTKYYKPVISIKLDDTENDSKKWIDFLINERGYRIKDFFHLKPYQQ